MKKHWKTFILPLGRAAIAVRGLIYIAAVLCISVSCKKQDRTTVVFGTVKDDAGKPVEGIEMALYGQKGILGSRATLLKTTPTNVKGEYVITHEISKEYHSGSITPDWFNIDKPLYDRYKEVSSVSFTKDCCRVSIGEKSQYDFVLVRK